MFGNEGIFGAPDYSHFIHFLSRMYDIFSWLVKICTYFNVVRSEWKFDNDFKHSRFFRLLRSKLLRKYSSFKSAYKIHMQSSRISWIFDCARAKFYYYGVSCLLASSSFALPKLIPSVIWVHNRKASWLSFVTAHGWSHEQAEQISNP